MELDADLDPDPHYTVGGSEKLATKSEEFVFNFNHDHNTAPNGCANKLRKSAATLYQKVVFGLLLSKSLKEILQ